MSRAIAMYTSTITGRTARAYYDAELREYRIKLLGSPHADYFTDDKDDAIATMKAMADFIGVRRERKLTVEGEIRRLEDARERDEDSAADAAAERYFNPCP